MAYVQTGLGETAYAAKLAAEADLARAKLAAAAATQAAPPATSEAFEVPIDDQMLLAMQEETPDYTWYYVGGGVALLSLGVAAYILLK